MTAVRCRISLKVKVCESAQEMDAFLRQIALQIALRVQLFALSLKVLTSIDIKGPAILRRGDIPFPTKTKRLNLNHYIARVEPSRRFTMKILILALYPRPPFFLSSFFLSSVLLPVEEVGRKRNKKNSHDEVGRIKMLISTLRGESHKVFL